MASSRNSVPTRILAYVLICFLTFGVIPVCIMTGAMQQRPTQDLLHAMIRLRLFLTRYELLRTAGKHLARPAGVMKAELEELESIAQQCQRSDQEYISELDRSISDYMRKVSTNQVEITDHRRWSTEDISIQDFIAKTRDSENAFFWQSRQMYHSLSSVCAVLALLLVISLIAYLIYRAKTEEKLRSYNDALNNALAKAQEAMENQRAAEQRKEAIIAIVSHELRTPLANASMRLELLDAGVQGTLSDQQLDSVRKTRENLGYLIHLINDMLCLERLNSYTGEDLEFTDVDVDSIILRSFERVESLAQTKQIELCYQPAHFTVRAEGTILEQVIVNLLSNAIKFSPPATTVTVCAKHGEQSDEIAVTDQGPGIPNEMLGVVFDKFKQVRTDGRGTGLGLNICKEIVEHHRGILTVRNNETPGCTFSIELPNAKVSTTNAGELNHREAPAAKQVVAHTS